MLRTASVRRVRSPGSLAGVCRRTYILAEDVPYKDLGADSFSRVDRERTKRRCLSQLTKLGLEVTLTAKEAA